MRLKSRIIELVGAAALVLGGVVGVAPTAQAASASVDCSSTGLVSTINVANSEAITFNLSNCTGKLIQLEASAFASTPTNGTTALATYTGSNAGACPPFTCLSLNGSTVQFTVAASGTNASYFIYFRTDPSSATSTSVRLVIVGGGGGSGSGSGSSSSSSSSASAAPADLLQQVGVPADGKCTSITDTSLNWAGVASGGWGISWAQWMNGGKGGGVCSRALFYNLNLAKWGVRA
jgi:hypothetical protein